MNDTKEAYRLLNAIRGTSEYANDATDGYFDESFSENIEDYIKAEKQIDKIIDRMAGSYIEYYTAMQKVIAKYDDFAKVASGKSLKEQLDIIKEYPKALASLNTSYLSREGIGMIFFSCGRHGKTLNVFLRKKYHRICRVSYLNISHDYKLPDGI